MNPRLCFSILMSPILALCQLVNGQNVPVLGNLNLKQSSLIRPILSEKPEILKEGPQNLEIVPKKKIFKRAENKASLKDGGGGDWGSSGGGSGIACFKTEAAAVLAEELISKNQALPSELIDQIEQLQTLEYWEWLQDPKIPMSFPKSSHLQEAVSEIHLRIARLIPLFAYRLEQAESLIELADWDPLSHVPQIHDAKPAFPLDPSCRQIQIAARYTPKSYKFGSGPSKKIPKVKVEVNQALFKKLDVINQAVLILHEQMYLIAHLLGHQSSDGLRNLVIRMFSAVYTTEHPTGANRYSLRRSIVHFFGDYINYFGDDLTHLVEPFTQESRLQSFYLMINSLRDQVGLCHQGLMPESEKIPWIRNKTKHTCHDYVMNPARISSWMTDEMAFLYIANFQLDVGQGLLNSEYLVAPFEDSTFLETSKNVINWMCGILPKYPRKFMDQEGEQKALNYCSSLKNSLSPMGTDQN